MKPAHAHDPRNGIVRLAVGPKIWANITNTLRPDSTRTKTGRLLQTDRSMGDCRGRVSQYVPEGRLV